MEILFNHLQGIHENDSVKPEALSGDKSRSFFEGLAFPASAPAVSRLGFGSVRPEDSETTTTLVLFGIQQ